MTTLLEASRQALEALESAPHPIRPYIVKMEEAIKSLRQAIKKAEKQEQCLTCETLRYEIDALEAKIAELREQAQKQEPVAWRNAALRVGEDLCSVGPFGYYDMTAEQWLDWALSVVTVHVPPQCQPLTDEQAEQVHSPDCALLKIPARDCNCRTEQEPVAWMYPSDYEKCLTSEHVAEVTSIECTDLQTGEKTTIPLYTSPPPRQPWVGLTDEEIWKFWWSRPDVPDGEDDSMEAEFVAAVRRVLAAHGIKGEA